MLRRTTALTEAVLGVQAALEAPDRVEDIQMKRACKLATVQTQQGAGAAPQIAHQHCSKQPTGGLSPDGVDVKAAEHASVSYGDGHA